MKIDYNAKKKIDIKMLWEAIATVQYAHRFYVTRYSIYSVPMTSSAAPALTISKYKADTLDGDQAIDIRFKITGISLALANSLRRVLLSDLPVVGFSNEWNDDAQHRKIVVVENTSGLHNEFLSHRLCLVPLCMYKNDLFRISSTFNSTTARREFVFSEPVPSFTISKHNQEPGSIVEVTTSDFYFLDESQGPYCGGTSGTPPPNPLIAAEAGTQSVSDMEIEHEESDTEVDTGTQAQPPVVAPSRIFKTVPIASCFPVHPVTQDPILLNLLKTNNGEGRKMTVICRPTVGQGYIHSSYCAVGTVAMSFEKQSSSAIKRVFQQKIKYMNQERENKNLPHMSKEHQAKLQQSFHILDSERIYKKNAYGGPSGFLFEVESTGVLTAPQLVMDGLCMLELKMYDILRCMSFTADTVPASMATGRATTALRVQLHPDKMGVSLSTNKLHAFVISLKNENHTTGNCIADYLKRMYLLDPTQDAKILEYASYVMKHPLKEVIDVIIKIDSNMSSAVLLFIVSVYGCKIPKQGTLLHTRQSWHSASGHDSATVVQVHSANHSRRAGTQSAVDAIWCGQLVFLRSR